MDDCFQFTTFHYTSKIQNHQLASLRAVLDHTSLGATWIRLKRRIVPINKCHQMPANSGNKRSTNQITIPKPFMSWHFSHWAQIPVQALPGANVCFEDVFVKTWHFETSQILSWLHWLWWIHQIMATITHCSLWSESWIDFSWETSRRCMISTRSIKFPKLMSESNCSTVLTAADLFFSYQPFRLWQKSCAASKKACIHEHILLQACSSQNRLEQ